MSGGSMNYLYSKILNDSEFPLDTPERIAFAAHLKLVAQALHDIEWVDSGDYGPGDENKAIRAAIGQQVTAEGELRSQHAEIERLSDVVSKVNARCDHLGIRLGEVIAERDALAEANEAFGKRQVWWDNKMFALEAERDALLEALKNVMYWDNGKSEWQDARAALARIEGGGNG